MAKFEPYLTHPLAEVAGWALLHSLWQGALITLLFAVGLTLLHGRNPQLRYLLGCATLALLIASPVVTGVMLYDPVVQTPVSLPDLEPTVGVASAERVAPRQGEVAAAPSLAAPLASSSPDHFTARLIISLQTSVPWLAALWIVGVVLLLLRFLGQALYVHRFQAHHKTPADVVWQVRARALASRLGVHHAWRLVQSNRTESPLTFGILRPLVVLPTSALTGMPAAQLEAILAHELAHIKRHDYLVNLVQCVIETLLFYHPAVWWVSSEVRRAREECCDDHAVSLCGDAKLYARALTNLESLRQRQPALALAATDMPLLARVRRLLGLREAQHTPPLATGVLLLLMVAATAIFSFSPQPVAAQNAAEPSMRSGSLWVSVSLGVAFDAAYTRISKLVIPDKAYVLVEERTATERRAVRVTRGASDTDFVYTYAVDGMARPFNAQARAWFDAALKGAALEPLKEHVTNQARGVEDEGAQLSSRLSYDDVSNRSISFALVADAHLEPSSMSTIETGLGRRSLLSQVAHYAAHNLVDDSETGNYLKLFIERSRVAQLETLTPDIMSIVAELEDEAVRVDVRRALEARLQNTVELQGLAAEQTYPAPPTPPTTPAAPKRGSSVNGVVVWNSKRLTNIKVELQEHPTSGLWETPRVLRTARTDAQGKFRFENVPPGDYMAWALGDKEGYLNVGMSVAAYEETSGVEVLRLDKPIEVISPRATTGTSLTPTLRWKPVPGAVRYEVTLRDLTPPEDPMVTPLSYRTDKPNLKIAEPLKPNRFYSWSVNAYTEDDTQIAIDYEGPVFSTGSRKTLRLVELKSIGASTVLPANWQQTSPGVFKYVNAKGEKGSLTFERRPRTGLEADLGPDALTELKRFPQRHAGRDWGFAPLENGSMKLATVQGGTTYLITVNGLELEELSNLTVELVGIVIPTMLRNFEITGQM